MAYFLKNLKTEEKRDCPCGWSRRPFANLLKYYNAGSFHGTIFETEKTAKPHFHVPAEGRLATHETYLVTHENTQNDALIYFSWGAVKPVPGTVIYVHPGTVQQRIISLTGESPIIPELCILLRYINNIYFLS